eukprot:3720700-Pleurochrysis_carterae.AAC.1
MEQGSGAQPPDLFGGNEQIQVFSMCPSQFALSASHESRQAHRRGTPPACTAPSRTSGPSDCRVRGSRLRQADRNLRRPQSHSRLGRTGQEQTVQAGMAH